MLTNAIVVAELPLNVVPLKPVPIVKALGVAAVTVPDPPNEIEVPLTVKELYVKKELANVPEVTRLAEMAIGVFNAVVA